MTLIWKTTLFDFCLVVCMWFYINNQAMFEANPLEYTEENLSAGKKIYVENCLVCHGTHGIGNGIVAKELDVKPEDLTQLPGFPAGFVEFAIKEGGDTEVMPSWKKRLTSKQINQVGLYVRSF